ncbi:hypothetical protein JCM1840_002003 [Sporobolomyces johnsonii]
MSIDLDWSALDAHLTHAVTQFLASAFESAPRPNFIGPLSVDSFSFGDSEPELELSDVRDVYKEFLQVQDDEDDDPFPPRDPDLDFAPAPPDAPLTSPITATRPFPFASPPPGATLQRPSSALFSPGLLHHSFPSPSPTPPTHTHARTRSRSRSPHPHPVHILSDSHTHPNSYTPPSPTPSHASLLPPSHPAYLPAPSSAPSPSFQLHLHLRYSGSLSLAIQTSLLINYPSPAFMSLPLSLTLTSLALEATLVVAFEGGKRRLHLSLLDPGPVAGQGVGLGKQTAGSRILKHAVVESEVGQGDKHVLKNVGKVEKFVVDVARRTLENEIVFPNFQTILF